MTPATSDTRSSEPQRQTLWLNYAPVADVLIGQLGDSNGVTRLPVSDTLTIYIDPQYSTILRGFEVEHFSSRRVTDDELLERLLGSDVAQAIGDYHSTLETSFESEVSSDEVRAALRHLPTPRVITVTTGGLDQELARLEQFFAFGVDTDTPLVHGWALGLRGPTPFEEEGETEDKVLLLADDEPQHPLQRFTSPEGHWIDLEVRGQILEVSGVLPGEGAISLLLKVSETAADLLGPDLVDPNSRELLVTGPLLDGSFRLPVGRLRDSPPPQERLVESFRIDQRDLT